MKNHLNLNLYTPEKSLLKKVRVKEILVPSVRGQLGLLPGHTAFLSLLEAGILKYKKEESDLWEEVAVGWGYIEVSEEEVRILAETGGTRETLKKAEVERKIKELEKELEKEDILEPQKRRELEREKQRLQAELSLSK